MSKKKSVRISNRLLLRIKYESSNYLTAFVVSAATAVESAAGTVSTATTVESALGAVSAFFGEQDAKANY